MQNANCSSKIKVDSTSTEFMNVHTEWSEAAQSITLEQLPEFLRHLRDDYEHDAKSIVLATCIGMVAAGNMVRTETDTEQSSAQIFWTLADLIEPPRGPRKLIDFGDMLYPTSVNAFTKTIPSPVVNWLQGRARIFIADVKAKKIAASPETITHWRNIIAGIMPFGYRAIKEEKESI